MGKNWLILPKVAKPKGDDNGLKQSEQGPENMHTGVGTDLIQPSPLSQSTNNREGKKQAIRTVFTWSTLSTVAPSGSALGRVL